MIDLAHLSPPRDKLQPNRMSDGSELFPYLWQYFLHHQPLRDWLMRAGPYATAAVTPRQASQGTAFCCNFSVPEQWTDMAASFDLGEMFIPDHAYSHFMCGTVVAATSYHKHLVCALGPAASRDPRVLPSYQTSVRRMIIDVGSSRSINIIEFSWMQDGALIVTVKILVPPDSSSPLRSAGCTGAFALFTDVTPAGPTPLVPRSLVSFVEAPRCPICLAAGSLSCYCSQELLASIAKQQDEYSSAVWPPRIANDLQGTGIDTYHNIRSRLDLIQHVAHVKITAHVVTGQDVIRDSGSPMRTYKLGPSRFVVKAVRFRPSNSFEADTLRQVADKLRLWRVASLKMDMMARAQGHTEKLDEGVVAVIEGPQGKLSQYAESGAAVTNYQANSNVTTAFSTESSRVSGACSACLDPEWNRGRAPHTCARSRSLGIGAVDVSRTGSTQRFGSNVTDALFDRSMPSKRLCCPRCDKTFSQQGSLNRHLKNIHEEKKIQCQYCRMAFGQMFDLKRHQRRKHAEKYSPNVRLERTDVKSVRVAKSATVN